MTAEQTALIITALTPILLAIMAGVGWMVRHSVTRATKAAAPPAEPEGAPEVVPVLTAHYQDLLATRTTERDQARAEVARLRELLIRHDLDPD